MSDGRMRLEELKRLWREVRRLPPPPPSLDEREAVEHDLHGEKRPRDEEQAAKLAMPTLLSVRELLEVVE